MAPQVCAVPVPFSAASHRCFSQQSWPLAGPPDLLGIEGEEPAVTETLDCRWGSKISPAGHCQSQCRNLEVPVAKDAALYLSAVRTAEAKRQSQGVQYSTSSGLVPASLLEAPDLAPAPPCQLGMQGEPAGDRDWSSRAGSNHGTPHPSPSETLWSPRGFSSPLRPYLCQRPRLPPEQGLQRAACILPHFPALS